MFNYKEWVLKILDEVGYKAAPCHNYNPAPIGDLSPFYQDLLEALCKYECHHIIFPCRFWSKGSGFELGLSLVDVEFYFDYLWVRGHLYRYEIYDTWQADQVYGLRRHVYDYFETPLPKLTDRFVKWIKPILNFKLW